VLAEASRHQVSDSTTLAASQHHHPGVASSTWRTFDESESGVNGF